MGARKKKKSSGKKRAKKVVRGVLATLQ